jgi:hypothetical protein
MLQKKLENIIWYENYKIKKRGLWIFVAIFLSFLFYYYVPQLFYMIYLYTPYDNLYLMYALGTYLIHMFSFALSNAFYLIVYALKVEKWKVNPSPWPWESDKDWSEKYSKLIKNHVYNQVIFLPLILSIVGLNVKFQHHAKEPVFSETIVQI